VLRLVERLEDRTLLAMITWGNASGGDWNTGSNWVGGVVPGVNDDAVIPNTFGSITVTYSSGTSEIHSLANAETLQISGGSFQIDAASTANVMQQSGGTVTGAGDLTVSGSYTWTGGTQSGTGTTVLASGTLMTITGGSIAVTAGRPIDDTAAGAAINWTSGEIFGTLNNPGQLTINNPGNVYLGGTLNNTGTITWTGAGAFWFDGGTLNNQAAGTVDVQGSSTINLYSGTPKITNAGTFKKSAGTGTLFVGVELDNSGLVQTQAGTVSLSAGGTHTGTFSAASGTSVVFAGGTHDLGVGTTLAGAGSVGVSGGTASIDSAISATNIAQSGGTLTGAGNLTVSESYTWTGGAQSGTGTTVLAAGAQMTITSGSIAVTAGRAIDDTATGAAVNWTSGEIFGTLNNPGQLTINNAGNIYLGGTLNNTGTITWTGSGAFWFDGGTLNNQAGGTVDVQGSSAVDLYSGSPKIANAGTFKKSAGTGILFVGVELDNSGLVQTQAGTVSLSAGGTHTGTFSAAAGTAVIFAGGTHSLGAGTTLAGAGSVGVSGGTASIDSAISATNIAQSGGTLTGAGNLTVSGSYTWTGGAQSGTGATVLAAGGQMTISGGSIAVTAGRAIDDTATGAAINWTSGEIFGTLNNPGQLTINNPGNIYLGGTLNNTGTITWTGSGAFWFDGGTLNNQAGGTVDVQGSSTINLYSGSPIINNAGTLKKSAGTGGTNIGVAFDNTGVVQVQTGVLNISGAFTNFSGTTLTGGTYLITAALAFEGADIQTNAANIVLDGSSSQIVNNFNGKNALLNFASNASGGSFTIQNGRNFTTAGAFSNAGTVAVGSSSTFTATGNYTQTTGDTDLQGGTLAATGLVDLQGGLLSGSGAVSGNVNNAAQVGPGDSAGAISITGNYTQTSAGALNIQLAGTTAGQFDTLSVTGAATLAGTLNVSLITPFFPTPPDAFRVLSFGSRSGDFTTETGLTLGGGLTLSPSYDSTGLTLTTMPGPTSTTVASSGSPSAFGQSVTFTATVALTAPGPPNPTGTVEFFDGATELGTGALASNGTATFSTSSLNVATHSITAQYLGDTNFTGSTSTPLSQVVNQAGTTTSLSLSSSTVNYGDPVTFTATVSVVSPGSGSPTGSVEFFDGSAGLGSGTLAGGTATFTTSTLAVGDHQITAQYQGDADFLGSTSTTQDLTVVGSNPYVVTITADSGAGSLRRAILNADAAASGPVTISFQIPTSDPNFVNGVFVIAPLSALQGLNNTSASIIIDGGTQTAFTGDTNPSGPEVALDGTNAGSANGLLIQSSGNEVLGVDIRKFSGEGIEISGGSNNWIAGDYIGTDATGTIGAGNGFEGVYLTNATNNTIGGMTAAGGNVISANADNGIILDVGANANLVMDNRIGTNAVGSAALGNVFAGIVVSGASNNTIGGIASGAGNLISGNGNNGVFITSGANGNLVAGNKIGTDASGTARVPNLTGVDIGAASNNTIGGTATGARNILSGNIAHGAFLANGASGNILEGNYIGTNAAGTAALSNGAFGVVIRDGAASNQVELNVISDNLSGGVVFDAGATGNVVAGNLIGTNAAGTAALGNGGMGVSILDASNSNTVGGANAGTGNVISGNAQAGVEIYASQQNTVVGNLIGTDATGMVALGNAGNGVQLDSGATNNTIGGLTAGARNLISGNGSSGIWIDGTAPNANIVQGNLIGLNAAGTAAVGNAYAGVFVSDGSGNLIGGNAPGARNVLSGNAGPGVILYGSDVSGNMVQGNYIGTDATGTTAVGNGIDGVDIENGAQSNVIGTNGDGIGDASEGNVISGNALSGVLITGAGTNENIVAGNFVGTDATGTVALGNQGGFPNAGVRIAGGAQGNRVGTDSNGVSDTAERNIISANSTEGVFIGDAGTESNSVAGNFIGTDASGMIAVGNAASGILVYTGAANNMIGGTANGAGNVCSANHQHGVWLLGAGTTDNVVQGNLIGTDASGTLALGNAGDGVAISFGANNLIGGTATGARNVISGNHQGNVEIVQPAATRNRIQGNFIGTDVTGTKGLGNAGYGIRLRTGTAGNVIGGTDARARNVISGNSGNGVDIRDAGTTNNDIAGNYIGTDSAGTHALANGGNGVLIEAGAAANIIGTNGDGIGDASEGNLISGNSLGGVSLTDAGTTGNVVAGNFIGTDASGTSALPNGGAAGVQITGGAQGNRIGTNSDGVSDDLERNVISGNTGNGVQIAGSGTSQNLVAGNYIGTDWTGTMQVGNGQAGVRIDTGASNNTLGGSTPAFRNVIGGNGDRGVYLRDVATQANLIAGNYIGVDATGAAPLPHHNNDAVSIDYASNNTVGGTAAGYGNVLSSAAVDSGVYIYSASNILVAGNLIGTDATGTVSMGFGNRNNGVTIDSGSNNTVGGTTSSARNVISGNHNNGVLIKVTVAPATANLVLGNFIGTDVRGNGSLGNGLDGVRVRTGALNNQIGGTAAGQGNVIAFNSGNGVTVGTTTTDTSTGNAIRGNSIHDNSGLGIDLGGNGVTLNDSSGHSGPNLFQNFPVLASAITTDTTTVISGTFSAIANTTYQLDFFSSATADPSGYGEGQIYLLTVPVTTDSGGNASFSVSVPQSLSLGQAISATATDPLGNTSEFSTDVFVTTDSTTLLQVSDPAPEFGEPITFTATVTPVLTGAPLPTGTVDFFDGVNLLGTGNLSGGTATFSTASLGVGSHPITAQYLGNPPINGSTSSELDLRVNPASTATSIVSSANPANPGQSIFFTATVGVVAPGSGSPTGTVQFSIDGSSFGSPVTLVAGQAVSPSTSTLSNGSHTVRAIYSGDSDFLTSTSTALTQVVGVLTTTNLAVTVNPSVYGQAVTFTASVASTIPGQGTPTGTVSFMDGSTVLATSTLNTAARATFRTKALVAGSHSITAVYSGDAVFATSTSPVLTQSVNPDGTTTAIVSSKNPSVFGQSVTFTATVKPVAPGSGAPTGIVTFYDGSIAVGTGTLDSSEHAKLTISALSVGTHSITAVYGGDPNFTTSTSVVLKQNVNQAKSKTTLSSSVNPSVFGQVVTFTATVTAVAPGSGTPSGTVNFMDGTTVIASGTLDSTGTATFTTSTLSVGTHAIKAAYAGDADFAASTSNTVKQKVNPAAAMTVPVLSASSVEGHPMVFAAATSSRSSTSAVLTQVVQASSGPAAIGLAPDLVDLVVGGLAADEPGAPTRSLIRELSLEREYAPPGRLRARSS
jgi:hypothetical protein